MTVDSVPPNPDTDGERPKSIVAFCSRTGEAWKAECTVRGWAMSVGELHMDGEFANAKRVGWIENDAARELARAFLAPAEWEDAATPAPVTPPTEGTIAADAPRDTWDGSCDECGMGNEHVDQHADWCPWGVPLPANLPKGISCGECGNVTATAEHVERLARYIVRNNPPTPPETVPVPRADGAGLIADERQRQIVTEGWTPEHDDVHADGSLARAAAAYALHAVGSPDGDRPFGTAYGYAGISAPSLARGLWPWDDAWWKPGDRTRALIKAGALIAAEIDRLTRAAAGVSGE